jgi:hypothetical protein
MAKINNQEVYPEDHNVSLEDYLIGTDSSNKKVLQTKTYPVKSLIELAKKELSLNIPKRTSDLVNDGENGVDKFVTKRDVDGKAYQFSNMDEVKITHGLSKYVSVTVIIGTEKALADVKYEDDLNTIIVSFKKPQTGIVLVK